MTHRQLRELRIVMALALTMIAVSGCANPWLGGPSAGGVSFKWNPDCSGEYNNNGRDIDSFSGEMVCPNGARGKIRVTGARGSGSADNATAMQGAFMQALVQKLLSPAEIAKLAATVAAMSAGAPGVP